MNHNSTCDFLSMQQAQKHIYLIKHQGVEYHVLALYTPSKTNTVHAEFYLMDGGVLRLLFEDDRPGILTDEDSCFDVGCEILERNFGPFME